MFNQKAASSFGDICTVCNGTGFVIEKEVVEGYSTPMEFAKACPRCGGKVKLKSNTGIPQKFCDADLSKFGFASYSVDMANIKKVVESFVNDFRNWEKETKGLYIWSSTPGSGKTFLSCCLANSISLKYRLKMKFTTVPDYLAMVGESYKRQQGMPDESEIFRSCELLVFDDVGAQRAGDWQSQEIFRIVNERSEIGKITIFTSNLPPEKLNLDTRTIDRIRKSSIVMQMPEESIRLKLAKKEQQDFLSKILCSNQ